MKPILKITKKLKKINSRPMIVDTKEIAALRLYVEQNHIQEGTLEAMANGEMPVAGDMKEYSLFMPLGYKLVYSIEDQSKGVVRHMSMSINEPDTLPGVENVKLIMKMLGFKNDLENCMIGLEIIDEDHKAINILEIIKKDPSEDDDLV